MRRDLQACKREERGEDRLQEAFSGEISLGRLVFGKREAGFRAITLLVYRGEKGCFKFPCALCVEPPLAALNDVRED